MLVSLPTPVPPRVSTARLLLPFITDPVLNIPLCIHVASPAIRDTSGTVSFVSRPVLDARSTGCSLRQRDLRKLFSNHDCMACNESASTRSWTKRILGILYHRPLSSSSTILIILDSEGYFLLSITVELDLLSSASIAYLRFCLC